MKLPKIELKYWVGFWAFCVLVVAFITLVFTNLDKPVPSQPITTPSTSVVSTPVAENNVTSATETTTTHGSVIHSPYDELRRFSDDELLAGTGWGNGEKIPSATSTFHFEDTKNGFSVEIPYSVSWTVMGFSLDPIEPVSDHEYTFGPLRVIPFEGCCAIDRDYLISIMPSRSVEQIRNEEASSSTITLETIHGFTVLKKLFICPPGERSMEESSGDCYFESAPRYEVLIPGANLVFSASPFAQDGDAGLRKVIQSLKVRPRKILMDEAYRADSYCGDPDFDLPPNKWITYTDTSTKISVSLPYNPNWGSERCGLTETEPLGWKNGVIFGNFVQGEGGYSRGADIIFETPTSTESLRANLADIGCEPVTTFDVSSNTTYSCIEDGLGASKEWHILLPNSHVSISVFYGLSDSDVLKIIQSLKVTK